MASYSLEDYSYYWALVLPGMDFSISCFVYNYNYGLTINLHQMVDIINIYKTQVSVVRHHSRQCSVITEFSLVLCILCSLPIKSLVFCWIEVNNLYCLGFINRVHSLGESRILTIFLPFVLVSHPKNTYPMLFPTSYASIFLLQDVSNLYKRTGSAIGLDFEP